MLLWVVTPRWWSRDGDARDHHATRSDGGHLVDGLVVSGVTLDLVDVGGGEPETGADLIGHDLDLGPSVSQLRCSSRPVTTIRAPLVRLSATFSARSRQQMTSRNEVDSSHSLVSRFCHRRLTASDRAVVA